MHLQPVYAGCHVRGGEVAEGLFREGLCLPSGSNLNHDDLARTADIIRAVAKRAATPELQRDPPSGLVAEASQVASSQD
jgi:hypothetical protein